jgi:hypothetical protein
VADETMNSEASAEGLVGGDENYFIPMADLLAGVVFVLLILIMSFALVTRSDFISSEQISDEMKRIREQLEQARAIERAYLEPREAASQALELVLARLSMALDTAGIPNTVDKRAGSLSVASEYLFATDSHVLSEVGRVRADQLANALRVYLPCLTSLPVSNAEACAGLPKARLDRLVVAAHAAAAPKGIDGLGNALVFTGAQALSVYSRLVEMAPLLLDARNAHAQPVIEFRGYGDRRPPPANVTNTAEIQVPAARVELLLRMDVPAIPDGVWRLPPQVPAR